VGGVSADTLAAMLTQARRLAADTPESRNRYVDFLRAASIVAVVLGHWLVITPWVDSTGVFHPDHLLTRSESARWLTWVFQVMPVFFAVGGFSNSASWESARGHDDTYAGWLHARLRRLVGPALPLLAVWMVITALTPAVFPRVLVEAGSIGALSPLWFLAVYLAVVALVPLTTAAWRRFGVGSVLLPIAAALLVDGIAFGLDVSWLRWVNYALIWPAIFQLGYAWRAGRLGSPSRRLTIGVGALAAAWLSVTVGPYPVAMIGVPGTEISNSAPPTAALLLLGIAQVLILSALGAPARRWLRRSGPWTATVLVNGVIMTLFVWHYTVMVVPAVADATWLGGIGLHLVPNTAAWWWARPLWLLVLAAMMALVLSLLARFEHPPAGPAHPGTPIRQIAATTVAIVGFAVVALVGTNGGLVGRWVFPALPIVALGAARRRVDSPVAH
jgi:peptidoglycan/LPS O-acetylase OafA/YrhL